jgi:hypothetical protein
VSGQDELITSTRQAAAVCGVTRFAVRTWIDRGLLPEPHGTRARWSHGCGCPQCRQAQNDNARAYGRARAQDRLSTKVRQQLLDAIYAGESFRQVLRDSGLSSNQVWGLTKTNDEWSAALEAALMAARRDDLEQGTNAAYVRGCVCSECREHQRVRMAQNRKPLNARPR